MRIFHFVLKARELGLSEKQIADLIDRCSKDRLHGVRQPWEKYLPKKTKRVDTAKHPE